MATATLSHVLVAAAGHKPEHAALLPALQIALEREGVTCSSWIQAGPASEKEAGREASRLKGVDMVVALGGDGFMMSTIRALGYPKDCPFYGVNYGRVGFLMNPRLEWTELAEQLKGGKEQRASYPLLEAKLILADGRVRNEIAFNDFVLERASGQTVELLTYVDDVKLNSYSGDGLIVATPGGSTAYSLAAGGPVVHHSVESMILTPLCPHRPVQFHSLQFSMLLSLNSTVRIVNSDQHKRPLRCVCDGRAVEGVARAEISHQQRRVTLLRGPGYDFVDTLVRKVIGVRGQ